MVFGEYLSEFKVFAKIKNVIFKDHKFSGAGARIKNDRVRYDRVRNDWVRNDRIRNDRLPFLIPMFLFNVDILYLFRFIFKSFYSLQTHAYLIIQHTKLLNVKNFEV